MVLVQLTKGDCMVQPGWRASDDDRFYIVKTGHCGMYVEDQLEETFEADGVVGEMEMLGSMAPRYRIMVDSEALEAYMLTRLCYKRIFQRDDLSALSPMVPRSVSGASGFSQSLSGCQSNSGSIFSPKYGHSGRSPQNRPQAGATTAS